VAGGTLRGRLTADDVTIFKSLGVAVEDVVSAELVWRRLAALGG
jgi:ornithine cyclodeaminase